MLVLPHFPITEAPDATDIQDEFLRFLARALRHTAFPWLDSTKVKKLETFIKHLLPVFESYRIRQRLLSNDLPWNFRTSLHAILKNWLVEIKATDPWSWMDGCAKQPVLSKETPLDEIDGPLELDANETVGNQNVRLQTYTDLRQRNKAKMEQIVKVALSVGLGSGPEEEAFPEVWEKLDDLLTVRAILLPAQTWPCANPCPPATDPENVLRGGRQSHPGTHRAIRTR